MVEQCANPLLLGWIQEWMDEARERNSKGFTVYKKAYESMKSCPLTFKHPIEAQQLHGLGPKLCDRLADKLQIHCTENGLSMPKKTRNRGKRPTDDAIPSDEVAAPPPKKARKAKPYVPALRSGPYAIILALSTLDEDTSLGLTKAETIKLAQPHCDASFTAPTDPTRFFTAWNSMRTLLDKDIVHERGRPVRRYMLTDDGWQVAQRMKATEDGSIGSLLSKPTTKPAEPLGGKTKTSKPIAERHEGVCDVDLLSSDSENDGWGERASENQQQRVPETFRSDVLPSFSPIILPPGSFSVHLILDSREIRTVQDREYISEELQKLGVRPITRPLPLGDALWVARPSAEFSQVLSDADGENDDGLEGGNEIVLDHIIERKRLDDLIFSIKDGRFHEQKFRLRRSGISNVTYIIEDFSISAERGEKYGESLLSAITSTQVVNGYLVKQTGKLDDTIQYLAKMTKMLQAMYERKRLNVIPSKVLHPQTYLRLQAKLRAEQPEQGHFISFSAFSSLCSKSDAMTLGDVFLKMLMCTRGVTGEKALEIQKTWKTPIQFIEALESVDGRARERMISDRLGSSIPRKRITAVLSAKIAEVWS